MQQKASSDSILPVTQSEAGASSLDTSLGIDMEVLEAAAKRSEAFHTFTKGDVLKAAGQEERAYLFLTAGSVLVQQDVRSPRGLVAYTVHTIRAGQPFNFSQILLKNVRDVTYRYIAGEEGANVIVIGESVLQANTRVREILKKRILPAIAHQYGEIRDTHVHVIAANIEAHEIATKNAILTERVVELEEENGCLRRDFTSEKNDNETLRDKLRTQTAKLEKQEKELTQLRQLRGTHTQLVEFLLDIDQKQRDAYAKFSDAFYGWIKVQAPTTAKDDADALIERLIKQGQLPFPKELTAALEEEVHSQVMRAEENAPHTSRSPEQKPIERESQLDLTAPRDLAAIAQQADARRSSKPPQASLAAEPPSTVQHGRRPSVSALAAMALGAPATKRASSLPPPLLLKPADPVPYSAMPPTKAEQPDAKRVATTLVPKPPPLPPRPRPATVPRPEGPVSAVPSTSPAQPAAIRKATPLGIDVVTGPDQKIPIPPRTQRGPGNDHSVKIPIGDLPPKTIIGVEPKSPPQKAVMTPTEPFQRSTTPKAMPYATEPTSVAGAYAIFAPSSEKTLHGVGRYQLTGREDIDEATEETGRTTMLQGSDEGLVASQPSIGPSINVPSLVEDTPPAERVHAVTRQYPIQPRKKG